MRKHTTATVATALRDLADVLDAMSAPAPAKTTRKAAPKAAPRPKVAAKVVTTAPAKGAQTRESLSRKEWNRTLTAKARLAGKTGTGSSVYSVVLANWADAQEAAKAGVTPDAFLGQILANC